MNIWRTQYKNNRRRHRHRCRMCNRIIQVGDQATIWRPEGRRKTRAVHTACEADWMTEILEGQS